VIHSKDCFRDLDTKMNVTNTILNFGLIQSSKVSPSITLVRTVWNRPRRLVPGNTLQYNLKKRKKAEIFEEEEEKETPKPRNPFMAYDEEFAKVTSFENQLKSLSQRGFQRSWRPFTPPKNMESNFVKACDKCFGKEWETMSKDFSQIKISGKTKAQLLALLAEEFKGHRVPNSLLHTMTSLDKVFSFYSTPVSEQSPYDKLEAGVQSGALPQNLHVQIEPLRFDPTTSTSDLGKITAFPRHSTLLVSPESRKKWKPYKAKHSPYKNSKNDD